MLLLCCTVSQVVGRHVVALLDPTWYIMMQVIMTFHVVGTYEIVTESGETKIMTGHPEPDFDGREWKQWYIFHADGDLSQPIDSDSVTDDISRIFQLAGIDSE
jgi:hypothetical protein